MERESPGSSAPRKRQVLVVDDHTSVRMSLRFVINGEPDMVVCGEAEDAQPALAMAEQTCPDIAIVDIALKKSHGLDLIRDLHSRYPSLPVFVHSAHSEELYAPLCFECGARGYMNKGEDVQTIVHAIRTVLEGNVYLSPRMLKWFTRCALTRETIEPRHPLRTLSPRELQVFEMLGRGLDIKEIASQLSLDHKTVELYRQRIKAKLGVQSAPEVLRAATLWTDSTAAEPELAPTESIESSSTPTNE
ncbi:MAG TPA: response regulator transcription factor [Verrucomicrobiae bacterium]|nr:response regulator transcription factor [Verrucomicrobiae bacterium]